MTGAAADTALLIAAHGERQPGASNASTLQVARAVAARGLVEVATGFINGTPSIGEALNSLAACRVVVYPLFAANGYFTRDRLVRILDEANGPGRSIELLAPLGLDRGLPALIADRARIIAAANGFSQKAFNVVLLAHGSRRNPASREATEWVAAEVVKLGACRQVMAAFLEERPTLEEVATTCPGPMVVVGMFSGEGLHGARDAPRLIAGLGRRDVAYAGVIGNAPGIEDLVVRAVEGALKARRATVDAP